MKKTRILLIDDEPHWINFVISDLTNSFEIVVVTNKDEAVSELEQDQFDLVIASSRRIDVLEIIQREYSDKQVVITTMKPTVQEARDSYRLGARDYFAKSFGRSDLLNRLQTIVSPPSNVS